MTRCSLIGRAAGLAGAGWLWCSVPTLAQLRPDGSTPTQINGCSPLCTITGGTQRGENLFHSFDRFSIRSGQGVYFVPPPDITTILTRVTGSDPSHIRGVLGIAGNANLFLLNPNGIIFDSTAQLDIRGSFLATTATGFEFDSGQAFSALNHDAPPLLAVRVPIGLQYENPVPGAIAIRDTVLFTRGANLILAGGPIVVDHSLVTTNLVAEGRLELASVGEPGFIPLSQTGDALHLQLPADLARANIRLTNQATLTVRGANAGEVVIQANRLELLNGSQIGAGIFDGAGSLDSQAGDIRIDASDRVILAPGSQLFNLVGTGSLGNAGNIAITASNVTLQPGAQITTETDGQGDAGDILLRANTVQLDGAGLFSQVGTTGHGSGGNITITTGTLALYQSLMSAASFGLGHAGRIRLTAQQQVLLDGSALSSRVDAGARGDGGDMVITTPVLSLFNNSVISVGMGGDGRAGSVRIRASDRVTLDGVSGILSDLEEGASGSGGNITITTQVLNLADRSSLDTSTLGQGAAGTLVIRASDRIHLDHANIGSTVFSGAVGAGGLIDLSTDNLTIANGSQITSSSVGQGRGGNVVIQARSLELQNRGQITTVTRQGDGGDIRLSGLDTLVMRDPSVISTSSGITDEGGGNGGNLFIEAQFLVAVPSENSDIIANAFGGRGGNVEITTQGIFGLVPRSREELETLLGTSDPTQLSPRFLPTSDITAISQVNPTLNGLITINSPDVDPSRGLTQLPTGLVDASQQVAQACRDEINNLGTFVVTGRGGLPPNPGTVLDGSGELTDWVTAPEEGDRTAHIQPLPSPTHPPLTEAQGWWMNPAGQVVLVATEGDRGEGRSPALASPSCGAIAP